MTEAHSPACNGGNNFAFHCPFSAGGKTLIGALSISLNGDPTVQLTVPYLQGVVPHSLPPSTLVSDAVCQPSLSSSTTGPGLPPPLIDMTEALSGLPRREQLRIPLPVVRGYCEWFRESHCATAPASSSDSSVPLVSVRAAAVGPSPWSAPPLPVAGQTLSGTSAVYYVVRQVSPISPSCLPPPPLSAPPNSVSHEPSAASTQLHHQDSVPSCPSGSGGTTVRAPTGTDFLDAALPALKKRPSRTPCTCTNCANGTNSKATNPDGSPRKKQHVCHYPNYSKVYRKTSHLRAHILIHKGERPFICHWLNCGKQFTRLNELQRHRRIHTGEKRFVCVECGKKFLRSDHLNVHTKTHQKLREEANSGSASGGGTNCLDSVPPLDNNPILSPPMPTPPTRAFPLEDNLFTDIPVN